MSANETASPSPLHTTGPWELRQESATWFEVYHGSSRHPICHVCKRVDKRDAPIAADARLIAAAPDLLDALRECAAALATARAFHKGRPPWVETDEAALVAARAAIDKAIGG